RVDTGAAGILLKFDTLNVAAGNLTDVTRRASLNLGSVLPPGVLPHSIVVRGYACDAAAGRNCSYTNSTTLLPSAPVSGARASKASGPSPSPNALIDTVIVVNGITVPLQGAGSIADAIYNANRRELYLTNPAFNRVDVFQVANTTFVAGGITTAGGQPWGIALWPRDTLGNYKDTIVVADGGKHTTVCRARHAADGEADQHDRPQSDVRQVFLGDRYCPAGDGRGHAANRPRPRPWLQQGGLVGVRRRHRRHRDHGPRQ